MSQLAKNTILYAAGGIAPKAISVVLIPVYTTLLSPADYGLLTGVEVVKIVAAIFITMGIERSISRIYFDFASNGRKFVSSTFWFVGGFGAFILLGLLLFGADLLQLLFPSIQVYPYMVLGLVTVYVTCLSSVSLELLMVEKRALAYVLISVGKALIFFANAILVLVVFHASLVTLLISFLAIEVSFALVCYLVAFGPRIEMAAPTDLLRHLSLGLRFALPFVPSLLASWIINSSSRVFIDHDLSISDVGIYSFATKIADVITIVGSSIMAAYSPVYFQMFSSQISEEKRQRLRQINSLIVSGLVVVMLSVALFSDLIATFLANPQYRTAANYIPLQAVACFISQITSLNNFVYYEKKRTLEIMIAIIATSLLSLILNYFLIPIFGLYGAVVATVAAMLFNYLWTYIGSKRWNFIGFSGISKLWILLGMGLLGIDLLLSMNHSQWKLLSSGIGFALVGSGVIWQHHKLVLGVFRKLRS